MDTMDQSYAAEPDVTSCQPKNTTLMYEDIYGGIPVNLGINVAVWLVLLLAFAILRRVAWDYGRIALVSRREEKWTSIFYGELDADKAHGSIESLDTQLHAQDRGFCSWIVAFVRVKDRDIVKKCGKDALHYLTFQRYLLLYLVIICVLSTAIIVPVNFTGTNIGTSTDFGHTTLANLDSSSNLLWIHACLAVVYFCLAVVFMGHFSKNLRHENDEQVSKSLMISNIPTDKCYKNIIVQHFQEGYQDMKVEDVQFAYNVEKLMELNKKREAAAEARLNSELELQKTGHRPTVRPYKCGQCLCCGDSCGCSEVDAINYYTEEEATLKEDCEKEKVKAFQDPLGVAFVTFENVAAAERIYSDFQPICKASTNPQPSSIHNELNIVDWEVKYAPAPENIYWAKLSLSGWKWMLRAILINAVVVITLFFLTTPTIVLTSLKNLENKTNTENLHDMVQTGLGPIVGQFLPTLLLWTFAALMPNLVLYSDQFIGHWTRSSEHHSIMRKTYIFLCLMILILPSLGLTSASALFRILVIEKDEQTKTTHWNCIFLSGNGAFFVNYVITSAFIGSALELLRFSELFVYGMKLLMARSSAERTSVRKHVIWEFQYGQQYAWVLCVFAMIVAYSISCPLIVPFGLVYLVLKHLVDRYNLYFAYKPSHISPSIHTTAINFVIIAVVFLQFNIVFFSYIRERSIQALSVFSTVILVCTIIFFFGRVGFGWFKSYGSKYRQFENESGESGESKVDDSNQKFVAGVLSEDKLLTQPVANVSASQSLAHSYGTMDTTRGNLDPINEG